jgi:hypothetical protein
VAWQAVAEAAAEELIHGWYRFHFEARSVSDLELILKLFR